METPADGKIVDSTPWLLDLRFHPNTGQLLVVDYKAAKVLSVHPMTGASSVFMTVSGTDSRLDGLTIDAESNVHVTDAHEGIIWKVGQDGGAGTAWVKSPLLEAPVLRDSSNRSPKLLHQLRPSSRFPSMPKCSEAGTSVGTGGQRAQPLHATT